MPPKKQQKLTCGGVDNKTGSCSSSCTNERNNHCNQPGGCFRFFCDYCIRNHSCTNLFAQSEPVRQNASAAITRGAAAIRDAVIDDDDSDDEDFVPKDDYDELTDDTDENNEEGNEEDEYDAIGDNEGSEAHEAWKQLHIGNGDAAERHGHSRKRKGRSESNPALGRKKKSHSNKSDPKSITPEVRIKQFPNDGLRKYNGELYCVFCSANGCPNVACLPEDV